MSHFFGLSGQTVALKEEINKTDAEIDQLVYVLYGLKKEEIKIVEEKLDTVLSCLLDVQLRKYSNRQKYI